MKLDFPYTFWPSEDNEMHDAPFIELRTSPRRSGVAAIIRKMAWALLSQSLDLQGLR